MIKPSTSTSLAVSSAGARASGRATYVSRRAPSMSCAGTGLRAMCGPTAQKLSLLPAPSMEKSDKPASRASSAAGRDTIVTCWRASMNMRLCSLREGNVVKVSAIFEFVWVKGDRWQSRAFWLKEGVGRLYQECRCLPPRG